MAAAAGGSIACLSCPSSSSFSKRAIPTTSSQSMCFMDQVINQRRNVSCLAVQETSTSAVAPKTEEKEVKTTVEAKKSPPEDGSAAAAPKPKPAAKAPAKTLSQLMEEDVIPSLKTTLESQQDISELELSFDENKLEGSFLKKGNPYTFWAFFPDGTINGPKGFSLSSYGSGVSTVEPFLVDEKKPTSKLVVFWIEKRLAAQGIIPVWRD